LAATPGEAGRRRGYRPRAAATAAEAAVARQRQVLHIALSALKRRLLSLRGKKSNGSQRCLHWLQTAQGLEL